MPQIKDHLRLGTRGSALAMAQSRLVADALIHRHSGLQVELTKIHTTGDAVPDRPLHEFGGKGVFTKEIELALLRVEIDFAVHSLKDMPVTMPLVDAGDLIIAAVPERGDSRDALVSTVADSIQRLPRGARVGTSSLRRRAHVLNERPDLTVLPVRGNVDSRLNKLAAGEFDALILAVAGLQRLGVWNPTTMHLAPQIRPAAGQGALAVQCRRSDSRIIQLLSAIDDPATRSCVDAEREVVLRLRGDCHSPIGCCASIVEGRFVVNASVAARGGEPPLVTASATTSTAADAVRVIVEQLEARGAMQLLHGRT